MPNATAIGRCVSAPLLRIPAARISPQSTKRRKSRRWSRIGEEKERTCLVSGPVLVCLSSTQRFDSTLRDSSGSDTIVGSQQGQKEQGPAAVSRPSPIWKKQRPQKQRPTPTEAVYCTVPKSGGLTAHRRHRLRPRLLWRPTVCSSGLRCLLTSSLIPTSTMDIDLWPRPPAASKVSATFTTKPSIF